MKMTFVLAIVWAGSAMAQPAGGMVGPTAPTLPAGGHRIAGLAFAAGDRASQDDQAAMKTMMDQMSVPYTGDPDHDFVAHMMPHHQGAIDMCKTELKYGHDAEMKRLCGRLIPAQQAEIRVMASWLARHQVTTGRNIPSNIQWK